MRGRLHTRVFVHFLGVLAVVGVVTGVVFATGWRSAFPRSLTERLIMFGAAEVAERFDDAPARDRMVKKIAGQLDVDMVVRDPAGKVLVARGAPLPPLTAEERAEAGEGPTLLHRGRDWFMAGPIRDAQSGQLLGIIEATPVRRFRSPSPLRPLLTAALALVIVAVLSVPLARRISRPVERLTEATRRFGAGDLSARVPVAALDAVCDPGELPHRRWRHERRMRRARRDELEELSRAWNEMADRVEHLVRGQKELLANVSHELRSPLARIRMALELLPRAPSDEARVRDIEGDLGELDRLIDDVLTASRLEATGLPAHPERVELGPLFGGLVERAGLDPLVMGHEVRVEVGMAPVTLVVDAALLRRALWNLIENAAKYGAAPITVGARVVAGAAGERVQISVSDEGKGIAAADRARVLDAFARLDRARTPSASGEPHRGFGLGLTIARRVAEVHGGSIRIEPLHMDGGQERGCRIVLELPRQGAGAESPRG